jgi:membrane-associated protease RseP (regulator of RpoE activity)
LASLTAREREQIPAEIDRGDNDYRRRLQQIHNHHPELNFEYFFEAQLLWDEGMAERAADHLRDHPERYLVVLAGSGHLTYGSGIPQRLSRRIELDSVTVINGLDAGIEPRVADYLLFPQQVELPDQGLLGIYMKDTPDGVTVNAFSEDSGAKEQGMEAGDQIVSLNGESIRSSADVKIALLDKLPGESVKLGIRRNSGSEKNQQLSFHVGLR